MTLDNIRHWVFDMDGTLTVPVHDFPAIKRALGIPQDDDILGHLAALPAHESAAKHAWLLEHERALALRWRGRTGSRTGRAWLSIGHTDPQRPRTRLYHAGSHRPGGVVLPLRTCWAVTKRRPKPPQRMVMIGDYLDTTSAAAARQGRKPSSSTCRKTLAGTAALRGMLG